VVRELTGCDKPPASCPQEPEDPEAAPDPAPQGVQPLKDELLYRKANRHAPAPAGLAAKCAERSLCALSMATSEEQTLDPTNWPHFRAQAHRMLDDILNYTEGIRTRPVWQHIPQPARDAFRQPLPYKPTDLATVHSTFMRDILPYTVGNVHPGFMGWVHGGGTPVGMLADMLAAGLNANLGGRDHIPIEVERQVLQWVRELFSFPGTASGLFVTGTSIANLIAVLVARTAAIGTRVRRQGVAATGNRLIAYTSEGAHGCIAQAMDLAGLGIDKLRIIPMNDQYQIDIRELEEAIALDKNAGLTPFFIAGSAGTVDVGAIDNLTAIADIAQREHLWFHVDGAYGALAMLAPDIAPRLAGIERADSIAFDFHKWGQVPYDAGFILVRDGTLHHSTFASPAAYLRRETGGIAAGSPWPCDFGPDLSRGFRALKTWFTIRVYGAEKLGHVISTTCRLAQYMKHCIDNEPALELLAPVALNIVCFRYRSETANDVNQRIVTDLQESGIAAPSTTTIDGCLAIRAAIVNHRTNKSDIDALIAATLAFGSAAVNRVG
jgi:aromatic-L-amino-acid decarboxylase